MKITASRQIPRPASSRLITVLLILRSLHLPLPSALCDASRACIPPLPPFARNLHPATKPSFSTVPGDSSPHDSSLIGLLNAGSSFYTFLQPELLSRYAPATNTSMKSHRTRSNQIDVSAFAATPPSAHLCLHPPAPTPPCMQPNHTFPSPCIRP